MGFLIYLGIGVLLILAEVVFVQKSKENIKEFLERDEPEAILALILLLVVIMLIWPVLILISAIKWIVNR